MHDRNCSDAGRQVEVPVGWKWRSLPNRAVFLVNWSADCLEKPRDLRLQRDQLVGDGEQRQFQTRGNTGLVENIRQMPLHRLFADAELLGDIAIAATFDDAANHFQFPGVKP